MNRTTILIRQVRNKRVPIEKQTPLLEPFGSPWWVI
jgi:hypothetical protein